jgi:hypothetical protein
MDPLPRLNRGKESSYDVQAKAREVQATKLLERNFSPTERPPRLVARIQEKEFAGG